MARRAGGEPAVRKGLGGGAPNEAAGRMAMVRRGKGRPTRIRPVGVGTDEVAVSDVLGSLLLVGITVLMAGALSFLILSFDGPTDTLHVDVELRTSPGADGLWDTGDERMELVHLGGESLDRDHTIIRYTADGTVHEYTGASLGSYFDDDGNGLLSIGETWESPAAAGDLLAVGQDEVVEAVLVSGHGKSQLVAAGAVTGGGIDLTVTSCLPDLTAPAGSFGQVPPDMSSTSSGAVTVTLTVNDACTGVDESAAATPTFLYCVAVTCTVPASFTSVAMTDAGTRAWSATIPSRVWLTEALAGKSIQYYATGMKDLAGNTAQTGVTVDALDLVATYTYVGSTTAVTGSVASLANAQAASASDGNLAELAEAGVAGSPVSVGPTKYGGATVTNGGTTNANNVLASDDARNEFDSNGDYVEVTGVDLPANAATVTAVSIGIEGRKASSGGTSPTLRLDYKVGAGGTYSNGAGQTISNSGTDSDYTRALSGSFTVADVESLYVRVFYTTDTNRNPQVDAVFVTVTYQSTPQTEYRMEIELEFAGVSPNLVNTLELRYRAQGDTFTAEAYNYLTTSWTACSGTMASTSLATFSCSLGVNNFSGGDALIRIKDVATTSTTQAFLYLDHARIGVV